MVTDVFPSSWFDPDLIELVIDWIANLPIDAEDKKRTFMGWAEEVGVEIEAWMVERLTGLPAGEV